MRLGITMLTLVLSAFCCTALVTAAEPTVPADLREALQRNAEQLSPIDITFSMQDRSPLPPRELEQRLEFPLDSIASLGEVALHRVIWQEGLLYMSRQQQGRISEQAWDGGVYHLGGRPSDAEQAGQRVLVLDPPARVEERERNAAPLGMEPDYFYFAGLPLPRGPDLRARKPAQSLILKLLDDGASIGSIEQVQVDGRQLTRMTLVGDNLLRSGAAAVDLQRVEAQLRNSPSLTDEQVRQRLDNIRQMRQLPEKWIYEFDLDPQLNYALQHCQVSDEGGRLLRRWTCDEFKQLGDRQLWLPSRIEQEAYHYPLKGQLYFDSPFMTTTMELQRIALDRYLPEQFRLDYTAPGTRIIDRTQDPPKETQIAE